jgi:signal transduction histidine kinase
MFKLNSFFLKSLWKGGLLLLAILIGVLTLIYTERFTDQLRAQENDRVRLWGEAISLILSSNSNSDLTMATRIIELNTSIPLILTDDQNRILTYRNLNSKDTSINFLSKKLGKMMDYSDPITVNISPGVEQFIYRDESRSLKRLRFFPKLFLGIISLYLFFAYLAFSRSRKSEQNLVWNGMAKETAHQLGTPLSALFGWTTILEEEGVKSKALNEIKKDLSRLQIVADRFSKIGSEPTFSKVDIIGLLNQSSDYMQKRSSKTLKINIKSNHQLPNLKVEPVLIGWVFENLMRNAIDAMDGKGALSISIRVLEKSISIDFDDSGKGISTKDRRNIFKPGFTTKSRGWGLGLSLSKRIVEIVHGGRLYLLKSQLDKGTVFRMDLKII